MLWTKSADRTRSGSDFPPESPEGGLMHRASDLFMEYEDTDFRRPGEMETGRPVRFPDPSPSSLEGFSVSTAAGDGGGYHSLFCGPLWLDPPAPRRRFVRALARLLVQYRRRMGAPRQGPFLICGVGNENAAADSLGPRAVAGVLATDPPMREAGLPAVCTVRTGVPRHTGIDTADMIAALAERTGAALIVTVDALCARTGSRLGTVAQITDCGLIPGSALRHSSGAVTRGTMPCPVLSLGVPTVVRASALNGGDSGGAGELSPDPVPDTEDRLLFVTRADTDAMVACYASLIARAVNAAFTGNPPEDVMDPPDGT